MGLKRYAIKFTNKYTNEIKYFQSYASDEYVVIDKIKYKKHKYNLTSDINAAWTRKKENQTNNFIHTEILNYRADLEDVYYITTEEIDVSPKTLEPHVLADSFFKFTYFLRNWFDKKQSYTDDAICVLLDEEAPKLLELDERLNYDRLEEAMIKTQEDDENDE